MTAGRKLLIGALVIVLAAAVTIGVLATRYRREGRQTVAEQRAEIASLEQERTALRARLGELSLKDPRRQGMPDTPVRIGVPTTLARELIETLAAGFVDQVTLDLKNLKVKKSGTVKKVITLGQYDLHVTINHVVGRLKTGKPTVTFGGNTVSLALPVSVVSGTGHATINFKWDGKNISGAVCGDQDITQEVRGGVKPDRYALSGSLVLAASAKQILAEPVFPLMKVNLKVDPSPESWAAAKKILDDKTGMCGFVLDHVDILGRVRRLIDRGFNVRLPTEKIKPLAVPVGVHPTMEVRGKTVALGITVTDLAITTNMIWLGSRVSVAIGDEEAARLVADEDAQAKGQAARAAAPSKTAPAKPAAPKPPPPKPPSPPSPSKD